MPHFDKRRYVTAAMVVYLHILCVDVHSPQYPYFNAVNCQAALQPLSYGLNKLSLRIRCKPRSCNKIRRNEQRYSGSEQESDRRSCSCGFPEGHEFCPGCRQALGLQQQVMKIPVTATTPQ